MNPYSVISFTVWGILTLLVEEEEEKEEKYYKNVPDFMLIWGEGGDRDYVYWRHVDTFSLMIPNRTSVFNGKKFIHIKFMCQRRIMKKNLFD